MLKKAILQGRSERRGEELRTALRVGRSPLQCILANGKIPQGFRHPRASERCENAAGDVFSILLVSGPCLNDDLPSLRIQADVIAFFQSGGHAGHIRNRRQSILADNDGPV